MAYRIHVYDDGDTEVKQMEETPPLCSDLVIKSKVNLIRELQDYGYDDERIGVALEELSNTTDWIKV